jgi:hypothetical protein
LSIWAGGYNIALECMRNFNLQTWNIVRPNIRYSNLYLSILLHYFTYNITITVTMQLINLICIFSFPLHYMFRLQSAIIGCYLSRQDCDTLSNDILIFGVVIHQLHCSPPHNKETPTRGKREQEQQGQA